MATFRIKATATVEIEKEIEASSKEEARKLFFDNGFSDIVEEADSASVEDIDVDEVDMVSMRYVVKAYDIRYFLDDREPRKNLPTELILEIDSDGEKEDVDFDGLVGDAIEDRIGYEPVKDFKYRVIEAK